MAVVSGRFINNAIVQVFKDAITQLNIDIGRDVTFQFDAISSGCPNSLLNPVTRTDSNTYNTDNPFSSGILNIPPFGSGTYNLSFPQGSLCPVCNGQGFLFAPSSTIHHCNISWGLSKEEFGIAGTDLNADCEIKVLTSGGGLQDAERAKSFIVDGVKCERIKSPIQGGLRDIIIARVLLKRVN